MNKTFNSRGAYKCVYCNKTTRDTGRDEGELDMCAMCLYKCYADNAEADYGDESEQYLNAIKNIEELKKEQNIK